MQNLGAFAGGGPVNVQQNNPDAQNNQIMRFIIHSIQQHPPGVGWRAQVGIQERIHWIKQMYVPPAATTSECVNTPTLTLVFTSIDSLRLLPQRVNDIAKITQIAVLFEEKAFNEANDKVGKAASFA